jgi:hypothetical protein
MTSSLFVLCESLVCVNKCPLWTTPFIYVVELIEFGNLSHLVNWVALDKCFLSTGLGLVAFLCK